MTKAYPSCMGNQTPNTDTTVCDECPWHTICFQKTYLAARLERFEGLFMYTAFPTGKLHDVVVYAEHTVKWRRRATTK